MNGGYQLYDKQLPLKANVTITSLEVQLYTLQIKPLLNLKYVFDKGLAELTWNYAAFIDTD